MTAFQGSFNGLTFGAGTDVQLTNIDEIFGFTTRGMDVPKPRQHGSWAGYSFMDEKIFVLELEIIVPQAPFWDVVAQVGAAFAPITDPGMLLPLSFTLPGWAEPRVILCRPTKGALPVDQRLGVMDGRVTVEMTAPDPFLRSATVHTASAGLPSPTAGFTFPVTFPVTFGASAGGSMAVVNAGDYIAYPVITVTGPVLNPRVTWTGTGQFFAVNLALGAGDTLTIDMGARQVTLNGSGRYNTIVTGSSWWGIPPGTGSIEVASADSSASPAVFTAAWQDTWAFGV